MRPPQWSIPRCISNAKTCCSSVCTQTPLPGGRGTCSQRPLSGKLSLKICRAASTNYLSATSLGPLTFFGSTSPLASFHLLSGIYTPQLCASHTLATEQPIRAMVQRHPHLLLPWAWAWPCNSLRAGSGVQQRHAGPQSVAKASYTSGHNSPYLRTRPLGI